MNWIKANKFLAGFFAVMLVGIGVLGYFLVSASSDYDTADENYRAKADELNRLRHLPLYPNTKNLKVLEAQKSEAAKMVADFQAQLATRQFSADEITPQEFQDRLKKAVTEIVAKAGAANMELPKDNKFYLGFDPYETRPPEVDAVGPLTKQLKAIQWILETLIDAKVTKLTSLTRNPLPEEKSLAGAAGSRRQDRQERNTKDLVAKFPVDLELVARQKSLAETLDAIVGVSARQFFIPRVVRIKNQRPKGPDRVAAGAPAGAPGQPAVPLGYIVGEEQLEVSMRLEIVQFAPPAEEAESSKPKASK